jgi:predicted nuclease of predicted toxin-antitoxin system
MRFLLDENVSYRVCPHLKAAGHDAVQVSEIGLTSTDDQVILDRALDEDRVLISGDHDFV